MIRGAVGVLAMLALTAGAAAADDTAPDDTAAPAAEPAPPLSKKEAEVRADAAREPASEAARARWSKKLARRIGKPPEKVINVFNGWTHENLVVPAKGKNGDLTQDQIDHFLRCRFTNKRTEMDPRLLPTAIRAARHFKSDRVVVVSAYRSPKYNLMLIKKGREVSRRSQHPRGKALDFRVDGVAATTLRDWAKRLGMGGVGFYQHSGFVHIDTAHVRYWNGR